MRTPWMAWMLAAAMALSACGGDNDRTKAKLRLVNASSGYPSLDLRVEDTLTQGAVSYGNTASYVQVAPGEADSAIAVTGSATALLSFTPAMSKDRYYSLLAYGGQGTLKHLLLDDNAGEPDSARALLRVVNAAPDAGALDIYLTASDVDLVAAGPVQSSAAVGAVGEWLTVNAGNWRLRITAAGNKADLRIDLPVLALPSKQVATLVVTPGRGGVLVNTLLLVQQGNISAGAAPQARVRLAAGVADGGAVAAAVGGTVLASNVGSPAVDIYTLLPAGTLPVVVSVNGLSVPMPDMALLAGADYTLLVRGPLGAAQASWIEDDNTLPINTGQAKLRLVHGVADFGGAMAMTADFVPVADGVNPGQASAHRLVSATTTASLSMTGTGRPTPLFSAVDQRLEAGAVYTVFVVGPAASAVGILRKDR
ncbi:MAG: DUF4397 domain-containing protein [Rubrivivax sp.]|nr:DUF4397 domain-containing protein [Rubrivivax sp.]